MLKTNTLESAVTLPKVGFFLLWVCLKSSALGDRLIAFAKDVAIFKHVRNEDIKIPQQVPSGIEPETIVRNTTIKSCYNYNSARVDLYLLKYKTVLSQNLNLNPLHILSPIV